MERATTGGVRALLEAVPDAILVATDGRLTRVNVAACRLAGAASPDELLGRPLVEFFHPDFRPGLEERLRSVQVGRDPAREIEAVWLAPGGAPVPVTLSAGPIESDGGAGTGVVVVVRDVSALRRAEDERARLAEQVQTAQRMESIGRLAGGVAHDFNNLLTVINGYAGLLTADLAPGDPHRERVQEIARAGERASALVRQLLAFGRQEPGQPVALDLNAALADAERLLARLLGEDITIELRPSPQLEPVLADPQHVAQILFNLAVNARDAMPRGGRLVLATSMLALAGACPTCHAEVHPGRYACLTVTDDGVGMDDATRCRIFDPFFTTKDVGEGTGLGLSTVHGLVEQAGGHVEVESAPGRGATFRIYLPALEPPARGSRADDATCAPAARATAASPGGTILLVEDQAEVRRFAAAALRACGYAVVEAGDPAAALALGDERLDGIDLLVSDVIMPGMSGGELAERLRARRPGLPLLFMSGYAGEALHRRGAAVSGALFLSKPFLPHALALKVREALASARAAARVLVVDDEEQVRRLLRDTLERAGFTVDEASDGREAMRVAAAEPPDVVVIDLVMPGQEGLETVGALRREMPGLGIVAISGASGGVYLPAARALGADAALPKPLRPGALLAEIECILGERLHRRS